MEVLETLLTEIEGCLNTRPLTYQETEIEDSIAALRPIDFIQRDMDLPLQPRDDAEAEKDDESYLLPREKARLQNQENHRRHLNQKQGCAKVPRIGEIVLLTEPCQKRYQWKMARILKLLPSSDGAVREVEVLSAKRVLRRPVNQLIPLEIEGNVTGETSQDDTEERKNGTPSANRRYNLRPRHKRDQKPQTQPDGFTAVCYTTPCKKRNSRVWPMAFYLKMALALPAIKVATSAVTEKPLDVSCEYQIECRTHGVYIHAPKSTESELCVNDHCIKELHPPVKKVHNIPSEEVLLDFEVVWKLRFRNNIVTVEKSCPPQHFCSTIDCTVCSRNILNPGCWPFSAIIGLGVILYLLIALCYTIFYVPVTVGRSLRLLLRGLYRLAYSGLYVTGACIGMELSLGNNYPGITGCLESCERIYGVPTDDKIYEIFSCTGWKERVKLRVQIRRPITKEISSYVVALQPTIPVELPGMSLTLSVLALPPFSGLDSNFITTGNVTALWSANRRPTLDCSSRENAETLRCTMHSTCLCSPAEFQVVCRCEGFDISENFRDLGKILPVKLPSLRMTSHPLHNVIAEVGHGVSSEIVMTTKEIVTESITDVVNERCTIDNTQIDGCYACKQGAVAEVLCKSSAEPVTAEIECDSDTFTVRCSPAGETS
ncbi:hypothetical protein GCK32_014593 [Trichostrongylus colubriformis]|uniref:Phlebovirus glycoprotein G2 fusion domain-containing protein n=1 Tax=Trichostrongylus colubriformis TaxID=6319 RepID=A0AAN8J3N9_TRICO